MRGTEPRGRLRWRSNEKRKKRKRATADLPATTLRRNPKRSRLPHPRHITALSSVQSSIAGAQRQMSHCGGWDQGVTATASCEAPAEPAA